MFALPSITMPADFELRDDGGVVGRDEVRQHPRAAGGQHPGGAEDVLVDHRHAGERAALARCQSLIRDSRRGQRRLGGDGDERVEPRLAALDAVEGLPRELDAGEAARLRALRRGRERRAIAVQSFDHPRNEVQARFDLRRIALVTLALVA